jgi:hypothetical protein
MPECCGNFPLAELRAVIALDQERNPTTIVDMARPTERFIKQAKFLIEPTLLL